MRKIGKIKLLTWVLALGIIIPVFAFSSHKHEIFVDDDAFGNKTGSSSHPYKTIGEAMDHADKDTKIIVRKGWYKENIKIKKGVELIGDDEDNTFIKSHQNGNPAVTMRDGSKISHLTIKDSESDGISVEGDARVEIFSCTIKDNSGDGIDIEKGEVSESNKVTIDKTTIKDNDRAGIYSEKRKVVVTNSEIRNNGSNGIDFEAGMGGWIYGNSIKDNLGNGAKLRTDGASLWMKNNDFRSNNKAGIEVHSSGNSGRINIQKTKFVGNSTYGIRKIQDAGSADWGKALTFNGIANEFWSNNLGNTN